MSYKKLCNFLDGHDGLSLLQLEFSSFGSKSIFSFYITPNVFTFEIIVSLCYNLKQAFSSKEYIYGAKALGNDSYNDTR